MPNSEKVSEHEERLFALGVEIQALRDDLTKADAEIERLRAELAKADARLEIVKGFVDNQIEQVRNAGR